MKFTTVVELLRGWVSSLIRSKLAYFDLETCTKLWNPLFNSYSMRDFTWHGCFLKVSTISSTWLQFLGMPQMYDHFVICNRCCQYYYKAFTRTRDGNKKKLPSGTQRNTMTKTNHVSMGYLVHNNYLLLNNWGLLPLVLAQKLNWTPAVERKETFPHLEDDFQSELSRPCTLWRVCS